MEEIVPLLQRLEEAARIVDLDVGTAASRSTQALKAAGDSTARALSGRKVGRTWMAKDASAAMAA